MNLRYQLFAISLLLLSLPWAGCQYLKAVDLALRDVQTQFLVSSAKSVADRLMAEPQLIDDLSLSASLSSKVLYGFPLNSDPVVDGYEDDWRSYGISSQTFYARADDFFVQIKTGVRNRQVYFFIQVNDPYLRYFNPSTNDLLTTDHISFRIKDTKFPSEIFHLYTSAPGNIVSRYRDANGRIRELNLIKGSWRENTDGYQIELSVGQALLEKGFNIEFTDSRESMINTLSLADVVGGSSQIENDTAIVSLINFSPALQSTLEKISPPGLTARILDKEQYIVARAMANTKKTIERDTPWVIEWLYRQILYSNKLSSRERTETESRWLFPEVEQAKVDGEALVWYRVSNKNLRDRSLDRQMVASIVLPLYRDQPQQRRSNLEPKGYIVLDKTTDQMITLTNSAFNQLFIYTLGIFLLVGVGLIAYASWLSWRISRLNRIAHNIVTDKGYIAIENSVWPEIKSQDELGDLSRSYYKLLSRLRENQDYLRTLSNKLSHELRTPIAIVRSSLENINEVDDKPSKEKYCQRAQQGIDRLSSMLNAMSSANRIEQSLENADCEDVNLYPLLLSLADAYSGVYVNHQIIFDSDKKHLVAAIAEELFVQMMDKLVDNATDFSPPEQPIIISLSTSGEAITISVENTGPLLPNTLVNRLFESMVSVRDQKGIDDVTHLGLGLYIVRLIADFHHIEVSARNREDGSGVVFSLILPINKNN